MFVVLFKYRNELEVDYILKAILLVIPAILTAAAGYIINDIYDVETDKINKPESCIIGHSLSKSRAWQFYAALNVLSIGVSYFFSQQYAVFNLCIVTLLYLYSASLKGTPLIGNIVVALCSASVIACCILLVEFKTNWGLMNFTGYIIFAFFISLIREIVKDIQDIEGDKASGLKSYPIIAGVKGAKIIVYVFTGIQLLLCGLYSFLSWGPGFFISSVVMGIITLALFYFINQFSRAKVKSDYALSSKLLKFTMFAGVVNLIFSQI